MEGTFRRLTCLIRRQSMRPLHRQQKPSSYRTRSRGVQNSPETAPLQGEVLTHTILGQRGVVPQESGTPDKLQEDESRETETAC